MRLMLSPVHICCVVMIASLALGGCSTSTSSPTAKRRAAAAAHTAEVRIRPIPTEHRLDADAEARNRSLRPIAIVTGYDRLIYLLEDQRVSMWVQRQGVPLVEGGEPERWIAIRVDTLDEPFPEFMLAR